MTGQWPRLCWCCWRCCMGSGRLAKAGLGCRLPHKACYIWHRQVYGYMIDNVSSSQLISLAVRTRLYLATLLPHRTWGLLPLPSTQTNTQKQTKACWHSALLLVYRLLRAHGTRWLGWMVRARTRRHHVHASTSTQHHQVMMVWCASHFSVGTPCFLRW